RLGDQPFAPLGPVTPPLPLGHVQRLAGGLVQRLRRFQILAPGVGVQFRQHLAGANGIAQARMALQDQPGLPERQRCGFGCGDHARNRPDGGLRIRPDRDGRCRARRRLGRLAGAAGSQDGAGGRQGQAVRQTSEGVFHVHPGECWTRDTANGAPPARAPAAMPLGSLFQCIYEFKYIYVFEWVQSLQAPACADLPVCFYNPDIMKTKIRLTREQSREQTRQRLLDATRILFAAQGYAATSVEQIALEAGYTRGAFYSNFQDKADIFLTLLRREHERIMGELQAVLDEPAPEGVQGPPSPDLLESRLLARYARMHQDTQLLALMLEARLHAARDEAFAPH